MNSPKPQKTLRLVNLLPTSQLSIALHHFRSPASPSIRRAVLLTPICIPPGGVLDLCHHLGVTYEEANRIVQQSPEVKAMAYARNALRIETYPPDPVVSAPAPVVSQIMTAVAVPVALPEVTAAPTPAPEQAVAPLPAVAPPVATLQFTSPMAPGPVTAPAVPVVPVVPVAPVAPSTVPVAAPMAASALPANGGAPAKRILVLEEPSMDWTEEKLRAHAVERGIDVAAMKSKTQVLRAIRGK